MPGIGAASALSTEWESSVEIDRLLMVHMKHYLTAEAKSFELCTYYVISTMFNGMSLKKRELSGFRLKRHTCEDHAGLEQVSSSTSVE